MDKKIGIIGAGNIGSALIQGFLKSGIFPADKIFVSDIDKTKTEKLEVKTVDDNKQLSSLVDIIILAVKPQVILFILKEIKPQINSQKIIISIAAGVSISMIENELGGRIKIVRVMPNTAAQVQESISAIAFNNQVDNDEKIFVEKIFGSIGETIVLDEKYFDAVTGLSGSGPAFIFIVISALADGGVKMGLSREVALKLAVQTVKGSAILLEKTGQHPEKLKDSVCSPGGTTISGIHILEKYKLRAAFIEAVEAATKKSIELRR